MEVLAFYWPNLFAGVVLVFVLGIVGQHLVARNQSMEVMLLGQEFQTSILMSALVMSLFESGEHNDHGFHLEIFISLAFVLIYHFAYLLILKRYRNFRIEGAIVLILILTGFSHLIVLLSPLVEMHMMKSYLGDIVTVSKYESLTVALFCIVSFFLFKKIEKETFLDTLEMSLFNKTTKKRKSHTLFSMLVLVLMLLSIHLFGSLFTVGAIIIPSFISGVMKVDKKHYFTMTVLNSISVIGAFMFLTVFDRLPTTIFILFFILIVSFIYSLVFKRLRN